MKNLKRILAVIVMVISILMLIVSLVGMFSVWRIRPQLTADLMTLAVEAETRVVTVISGLDQINTALVGAHDQVSSIEQDIQTLGSNVEENRPLATAISDRLDFGLLPLIESTRELLINILDGVYTLNSTIESLNAFPFVSIPAAELERIENLSQYLDNIHYQTQDLRTTMNQRRNEIIEGSISIVTTPTSQIIRTLDELLDRVTNISRNLVALQERIINFKLAIGRWLIWTAVISTLILLWFTFSQVGLFILGWRFYSGQDLLVQAAQAPLSEIEQTGKDQEDADSN